MQAEYQRRNFIFVGGLHRSGTSLLFKILRAHPLISGFSNTGVPEDEGQLLQSVYPAAREFGGPGRFGLDPASFLDEQSPLVCPENAEKLFQEWSRHWDLSKEWLLEKSPPNLVRARFLQALFPNSHFIMLLRHPVAVALATRKWSRTSVVSLIEHWVCCHERFAADRVSLKKQYTLKYEDLVSDPAQWAGQLWDFLGVPPSEMREDVTPGVNDRYFERWRALAAKEPERLDKIIADFELRVAAFGYSLRDV